MSISFFSRKGRVKASQGVARTLNVMNMLGPLLLLGAIGLITTGGCDRVSPEIRNLATKLGLGCLLVAIAIRLVWGITVHRIGRGTR